MTSAAKKIEFVETHPVHAESGGLRAATDCIFSVDGAIVTVRVHRASIRTLDGGQLSPDEVALAARTFIEIEMEDQGDLKGREMLVLDSVAMGTVAGRLGWLDRFYAVSVSDYAASVDHWRLAQQATRSQLPKLDQQQKELARKFKVSEEEYARGVLAGIYGQKAMRGRGRSLGEVVQGILDGLGPDHRVVAVFAEMSKGRWIVRIHTPNEVANIAVPRELADDVVDSGATEDIEKLRVCVLSGLGRKEFLVRG